METVYTLIGPERFGLLPDADAAEQAGLVNLRMVLARRIGLYNTERYHSSPGNRAPLLFIRQEHSEYALLHIGDLNDFQ